MTELGVRVEDLRDLSQRLRAACLTVDQAIENLDRAGAALRRSCVWRLEVVDGEPRIVPDVDEE